MATSLIFNQYIFLLCNSLTLAKHRPCASFTSNALRRHEGLALLLCLIIRSSIVMRWDRISKVSFTPHHPPFTCTGFNERLAKLTLAPPDNVSPESSNQKGKDDPSKDGSTSHGLLDGLGHAGRDVRASFHFLSGVSNTCHGLLTCIGGACVQVLAHFTAYHKNRHVSTVCEDMEKYVR